VGQAHTATQIIDLEELAKDAGNAEWKSDGHTNPVRLRWLTIPVLTSDATDGFAYTVNVNLDGSTTQTNYSAEITAARQTSITPEPSLLLVTTGLTIALVALRLRRRRAAKALT